jgi:CDP-diacylglycerol--glycerol-3-phosphate 3-phosphatidyltransferase
MFTLSTYALKSRFQALLRPLQHQLMAAGASPNQITLTTCLLCVLYAALLAWSGQTFLLLTLLPAFLLLRIMLNALDGMVAKATGNTTPLGMALNELCDVISDVALLSAFFLLLPIAPALWWALIVLALLAEFVSLSVYQACRVRPYSGPFGKSDRAVFLGVLAIALVAGLEAPAWLTAYTVAGIILAIITIINRLQPLLTTSRHA